VILQSFTVAFIPNLSQYSICWHWNGCHTT